MCTAIVSIDPTAAWPALVAFVRDEQRDRPSDPAGPWWPDTNPGVLGGRDGVAGGTWLAVDPAVGRLALLTNWYDPDLPSPESRPGVTRGRLPLQALAAGASFDLADLDGIDALPPFHLLVAAGHGTAPQTRSWSWDGSDVHVTDISDPGTHVVASRSMRLPGEPERRARIGQAFAATRPSVSSDPDLAPLAAWGDWIDLLDGRDAVPDDHSSLVVCSIRQVPGFGTVGASLVGIAADGHVRYDINRSNDVDPAAWRRVMP